MAKAGRTGPATLRFLTRTLPGVKQAPFPGFIEPCLATLRPKPPVGTKWQFEFKLDGYRMQIHKRDGVVKIYSRNGLDWTDKLPAIVTAAKHIPATCVLDGEIVVQNDQGLPDFQALKLAIVRGSAVSSSCS